MSTPFPLQDGPLLANALACRNSSKALPTVGLQGIPEPREPNRRKETKRLLELIGVVSSYQPRFLHLQLLDGTCWMKKRHICEVESQNLQRLPTSTSSSLLSLLLLLNLLFSKYRSDWMKHIPMLQSKWEIPQHQPARQQRAKTNSKMGYPTRLLNLQFI